MKKEVQQLAKFIPIFKKSGNGGESIISSKVLSLKQNKLSENSYYIFRFHGVVCNNYVS